MTDVSLKALLMGFIAGAIAVVTAHEIIDFLLLKAGLFPRVPWSMQPSAVTGVPQIVSDMFWGGLWGVLFVTIQRSIPGESLWLKGLIFGIIGPALIGVFILVPLITGRFPLFFGGDPKPIISVLLILAGFGAVWVSHLARSDGLAAIRHAGASRNPEQQARHLMLLDPGFRSG